MVVHPKKCKAPDPISNKNKCYQQNPVHARFATAFLATEYSVGLAKISTYLLTELNTLLAHTLASPTQSSPISTLAFLHNPANLTQNQIMEPDARTRSPPTHSDQVSRSCIGSEPDPGRSQQAAKFANVLLNFKLATDLATPAPDVRHTTSAGGTSVLHNSNLYTNVPTIVGPAGKPLITNERVVVTNDEARLNNHRNIFSAFDNLGSYSDSAPGSPVSESHSSNAMGNNFGSSKNDKSFSYNSNNVMQRLALNEYIDLATLDQKALVTPSDNRTTSDGKNGNYSQPIFNPSVIYVSPETLLRAQKAKATFELKYDVVCCFEGSTNWLGQEREPPRTESGERIFTKYNPLQTIRNRKVRDRDWNRLADYASMDGSDLSPYGSRRGSTVSSGSHNNNRHQNYHPHLPHPFHFTRHSHGLIWNVNVYELFTDLNWRVSRYYLMRNKHGMLIFPPKNGNDNGVYSDHPDHNYHSQNKYLLSDTESSPNHTSISSINPAEEIALEKQILKLDHDLKEPSETSETKGSPGPPVFDKITSPISSALSMLPASLNNSSATTSNSSNANSKSAVLTKIHDKLKGITNSSDQSLDTQSNNTNDSSINSTHIPASPRLKNDTISTVSLPSGVDNVDFTPTNNKIPPTIQQRFSGISNLSNSISGSLPNLPIKFSSSLGGNKEEITRENTNKESTRQSFSVPNPLVHLRKKSIVSTGNVFNSEPGYPEPVKESDRNHIAEITEPVSLFSDPLHDAQDPLLQLERNKNSRHEASKFPLTTSKEISWDEQTAKQEWINEQDKRDAKELKDLKEQKEKKLLNNSGSSSVEKTPTSTTVQRAIESKSRTLFADNHPENVRRKMAQSNTNNEATSTKSSSSSPPPILLVNDQVVEPQVGTKSKHFKNYSSGSYSDYAPSEKTATHQVQSLSGLGLNEYGADSEFFDTHQQNPIAKKQVSDSTLAPLSQKINSPVVLPAIKSVSNRQNRSSNSTANTNTTPRTPTTATNHLAYGSTLSPPTYSPHPQHKKSSSAVLHTRAEHDAVVARQRQSIIFSYALELSFLELVHLIRFISMRHTIAKFNRNHSGSSLPYSSTKSLYYCDKKPGMICPLQGPAWPKRKEIEFENERAGNGKSDGSSIDKRKNSMITELDTSENIDLDSSHDNYSSAGGNIGDKAISNSAEPSINDITDTKSLELLTSSTGISGSTKKPISNVKVLTSQENEWFKAGSPDVIPESKVQFIAASQQKKQVCELVYTILDTTSSSRNDIENVRALLHTYTNEVSMLRRTRISTTSTRLDNLLATSDQTLNKLSTTLNLEVKKVTGRMDRLEVMTRRAGFWLPLFGGCNEKKRANNRGQRTNGLHNHNSTRHGSDDDLASLLMNISASTKSSVSSKLSGKSSLLSYTDRRNTKNDGYSQSISHLSHAARHNHHNHHHTHTLSSRSSFIPSFARGSSSSNGGGSSSSSSRYSYPFSSYTAPSLVTTIGYTLLEYTLVMIMWIIWGCASILFSIKYIVLRVWCVVCWLGRVLIWC